MPGERVARFTITVTTIQKMLARSRAVIALVMSRRLLVARWTAAKAPRIVATVVACAGFLPRPIVVVGVAAARRIRVTLVVARVEIARIEVHSRTTLPM
ncbi:MAG: hypothetical protein LC808_24455 [Actinobacteria bacterium]|nr:hypothetical protein [Actinomycetota bacterium]